MESDVHISLCTHLMRDISRIAKIHKIKRFCGSTAAAPSMPCPPKMHGFIPDFYAYTNTDCFALVGEAKTTNDIVNEHTDAQLQAYIEYIEPFTLKAVLFRVENQDFFLIKRFLDRFISSFNGSFYINGELL